MKLYNLGLFGRLAVLTGLLAVSLFVLVGGLLYWADRPVTVARLPVEFQIPPGAPLSAVITRLQDAGVNLPEQPFKLLARYRGVSAKIKPGIYSVSSAMTPGGLLDMLVRGAVVQVEVVIPEGWTFRQVRSRLESRTDLRHEISGLSDSELLHRIGATEAHPEGLFFPDTYRVDKGSSDLALLRAAHKAMQDQLAQAWASRDPASPLSSPYQALILASIVEKETGRPEDRPLVASVFINRLRKGMLLQTDPTVIYGMGATFDGNIRRRDLRTDTPYNTYTRSGLPPTPIAMPGRASLDASVGPTRSEALYFVSRGDGTSEFSSTLVAHNRAVNRYQRGGK